MKWTLIKQIMNNSQASNEIGNNCIQQTKKYFFVGSNLCEYIYFLLAAEWRKKLLDKRNEMNWMDTTTIILLRFGRSSYVHEIKIENTIGSRYFCWSLLLQYLFVPCASLVTKCSRIWKTRFTFSSKWEYSW